MCRLQNGSKLIAIDTSSGSECPHSCRTSSSSSSIVSSVHSRDTNLIHPHNTQPQYLLIKFLAGLVVCFYFHFLTPHVSFLPQPQFVCTEVSFFVLFSLAQIVSFRFFFFFSFLFYVDRMQFISGRGVVAAFLVIIIAIVDVCDLLPHQMRALPFIQCCRCLFHIHSIAWGRSRHNITKYIIFFVSRPQSALYAIFMLMLNVCGKVVFVFIIYFFSLSFYAIAQCVFLPLICTYFIRMVIHYYIFFYSTFLLFSICRLAKSLSVLLHIYNVHQRSLGRWKNIRRVCSWISCASGWRIRTMY